MLRVILCVMTLAAYLSFGEAAKILSVYQSPFISHQMAFRSVTEELLKRGFEVNVATTDPAYPKGKTPMNLIEIDLHNVTYNIWKKQFTEHSNLASAPLSSQISAGMDLMIDILINQFESEILQPYIKGPKKTFDMVLAEQSFPPSIIFSQLYQVPFVLISTLGLLPKTFNFMGVPRHILFYPKTLRDRAYNISIFDSYVQIYKDIVPFIRYADIEQIIHEKITPKIIPDLPTFGVLNENVHMLLVNVHSVWEGIRPYPPNYIIAYGFPSRPEEAIPKDYQSYLDSSKNGVLYVSFGTSVLFSKLPGHITTSILRVFSELPYDVLLKYDMDELPGKSKNVKIFKWLPQPNVLRHPKIKLFITQGGQHSIDEAIEAGVPLVVIPKIFDQFANAERCVHHGIGIKLDLKSFNDKTLLDAITTATEDKRYKENIIKLRTILHDNPMKSMDRLMWAIEYVIRHRGSKHMRSPSANMSWAEYFEFELLSYFLSFVTVILFIIVKLLLAFKIFVIRVFRIRREGYIKNH